MQQSTRKYWSLDAALKFAITFMSKAAPFQAGKTTWLQLNSESCKHLRVCSVTRPVFSITSKLRLCISKPVNAIIVMWISIYKLFELFPNRIIQFVIKVNKLDKCMYIQNRLKKQKL
ncbi:Hypothetical_protein [Hexamita inflata]|uniref:Hypothetical_protein n=1 Tax=Hexamita inflata TaxID=28002 RepID=A0AA86UHY2_9EUKA|nr:Hypothetical protein HINF_LOCUS39497 [Hexamita inflata]